MPIRIDPRVQTLVNAGAAATRTAAQVAPAPLKPLLQVGATGFEAARRVLVNLEGGGAPPPIPPNTLVEPWRVTVTEDDAGPVNFRASAGGNVIGSLPAGTELEVTGSPERSAGREWLPVRTPDGREGWIASERAQHLSGTARGYPYVLEDGRDGSGSTAVDHALTFVSASERAALEEMYEAMPAGPNKDALEALLERIPEGNTTNTANGYAHACLGFVNKNFGIGQAADRAPQMYNPAAFLQPDQLVPPPLNEEGGVLEYGQREVLPHGQIYSDLTGSAYGAWLALENASRANPGSPPLYTAATQGADGRPVLDTPLEEGTMLYFAPSQLNGNAGHVCIATGVMAADGTPLLVTSGWTGSPAVKVMSLAEMQRNTGTYLGYTTPDQAFQAGRWGGGSSS